MVHATWGNSFLKDEIEATEPDGLSIWYLGCNGFVVRSAETTVYIDPYFGDGDPPSFYRMIPVPLDPNEVEMCDGILITHEHFDHFHPDSYGPLLANHDAEIHATRSCFEDPQKEWEDFRAPEQKQRIVEPGDTYEIGDLTVHVRAGNDPDAVGDVSYVITHESGVYYNAGDSRYAEEFHEIGEEFDIDVGNLVFGTHAHIFWHDGWEEGPNTRDEKLYMNENEVVKSANALQLDRLVPCHYDMWKGSLGDPTGLHKYAASYKYPRVLDIAEIGDRFDIGSPGIVPSRDIRTH